MTKYTQMLCFFLLAVAMALPVNAEEMEATESAQATEEALEVAEAVEAEAMTAPESLGEVAEGKVASINMEDGFITLESPAAVEGEAVESSVFYFSEDVMIMKNGETLGTSDVTVGDNISVSYVQDEEGNNLIQMLEIAG